MYEISMNVYLYVLVNILKPTYMCVGQLLKKMEDSWGCFDVVGPFVMVRNSRGNEKRGITSPPYNLIFKLFYPNV